MTHPPDFGDVRSLMNEPYSAQIWDQVCAWVQEFEGDELKARVLPYMDGHLRRWTDEQRVVPRTWLQRLIEDQGVPWMPVAKALIAHRVQLKSRRHWIKQSYEISRILERSELRHIAVIDFSYSWFAPQDLAAFKASPHLDQLFRLVLRGVTLEDGVVWGTLFDATSMPELASLDMSSCKLDDEDAERLVYAKNFGELVELSLWDNHLTRHAMVALGEAPRTANLQILDLGRNPLGQPGLEALGHRGLRALRLDQTQLGDKGAEWLASAGFHELEELNLWKNAVGDDGVAALAASPSLGGLHMLNLGRNDVGDAGAMAIAESSVLTELRELNLFGNRISDAGAFALAGSPNLAHLDALHIKDNAMTSRGEAALASSPHLPEHIREQW